MTCPRCGHEFVARRKGRCPRCLTLLVKEGERYTRMTGERVYVFAESAWGAT